MRKLAVVAVLLVGCGDGSKSKVTDPPDSGMTAPNDSGAQLLQADAGATATAQDTRADSMATAQADSGGTTPPVQASAVSFSALTASIDTPAMGGVTFTNQGPGPTQVTDVVFDPPVSGFKFAGMNWCRSPVAAHASCTVQLSYSPETPGIVETTIVFTHSGNPRPVRALVTGALKASDQPATTGLVILRQDGRVAQTVGGMTGSNLKFELRNKNAYATKTLTFVATGAVGVAAQDPVKTPTCRTGITILQGGESCFFEAKPTAAGRSTISVQDGFGATATVDVVTVTP